MKRIYTTLLVVLGLSTAAFSQTISQTKGTTEFGVNVGFNQSTVIASNSTQNAGTKGGINVGVSGEYYFSDRWGIKAKAQYDQKGWANGFVTNGITTVTTDYRTNYLTVPVMANWHFGKTRNWYLNFGPYVSFLLSATAPAANNLDVKFALNGVDVGFDGGIGIKFPVGKSTKIFLEINGQGGGSDVSKNPGSGSNYQNSTTNFNVGINF